jgi:O-antigen/teichoic acid export membrane protein
MLQPLIEGVLRGLKRFYLIGILQTFSSIFYLCVVSSGILLDGLNGALIAVVLYYVLYSVVSLFILQRKYRITKYFHRLRGFWREKTSLYSMIMPVFLMSFVDAPVMWVAQIILSKAGTMAAVGSMTAMMQIRNLAMLIPSYFTNTFIAFAGELNVQQRYDDYYRQFSKIEKKYLLFGLILFVVFSIFSKPILFFYGREFMSDWPVMIISNLGIPIVMLASLYRVDLLLKDHQRSLLIISIIWNMTWLIILYSTTFIKILPLYSFFISQNIAAVIFVILLYKTYHADKTKFLY